MKVTHGAEQVQPPHLLLRLQIPRVYPSHVVGFCADIIVSLVLDEVHAGVIRGLCTHTQTHTEREGDENMLN